MEEPAGSNTVYTHTHHTQMMKKTQFFVTYCTFPRTSSVKLACKHTKFCKQRRPLVPVSRQGNGNRKHSQTCSLCSAAHNLLTLAHSQIPPPLWSEFHDNSLSVYICKYIQNIFHVSATAAGSIALVPTRILQEPLLWLQRRRVGVWYRAVGDANLW